MAQECKSCRPKAGLGPVWVGGMWRAWESWWAGASLGGTSGSYLAWRAVTRMGQAALRPLGVGQSRGADWAGGEMVWWLVPGLGWGQRLSISPVPTAAPPLLSQGGRSNQGLGDDSTGLLHRQPLGKAPCAPWGFGCPARRDAHSSSLSTAELCRGVLSLPGLLPSPAAPPRVICSWDSQPS